MKQVAKRIITRTERGVRKVSFAVGDAVVKFTPKDTGRAKANWSAALDRYMPLAVGPGLSAPGTLVFRSPRGGVLHLKAVAARFRIGRTIVIGNALPYIMLLENGWSRQAPSGMAKQAVVVGRTVAKRLKLLDGGGP